MIRLVNDLLQLSHLDSRQVEIRKVPSDIMTMFEDISDRFSFQLKQKQLEITIRIDDRIKMVPMDPDKIDQVLDNLLSNAIKFTPEGGHIEVAVRRLNQDFVEVSVQDTGIGIPEKDLPRIFERFYRVDKARSRSLGGTGLGLSIAREIVRAHGGEIHLESKWNEGTRVTFTLPVKWTAEGEEHGG
jgi:two-component system sensor histidine kinase VicK